MNIKNRQRWAKIKSGLKSLWQLMVFMAYIQFYIMCLVTFVLVLILSLFVLVSHGADIQNLAKIIPKAGYWMVGWTFILMVHKLFTSNDFNKIEKKAVKNK